MNEMVNLLVDLRAPQFDETALARARAEIEAAGFSNATCDAADDEFLAWIDDAFGGTWSSEAFAGKSVVAKRDGAHAGFATYDPRGLTFSWLRGLGAQAGVGIFGPFGVAPAFRGSPAGRSLLIAALASLRREGYSQALVPAVGNEKLIGYYTRHAGARVAETFDKAQWRRRKHRTVVLASGNGSNFQAVLDGAASGAVPIEPVLLLSNKPSAYALERARAANVPAIARAWDRKAQTRAEYDAALLDAVRRQQPELVLLLGWMHLLPPAFIEAFPETINIHPAFLPLDQRRDDVAFPDGTRTAAFRGAYAVRDAFASGARWVGASSHRVTLDADRGPVLVRAPLAVLDGETEPALMARLHPLEHRVLAGGVMRWVYER